MDTIADFLTRIRNAGLAKHEKVDVPSSNMREGIAKILENTGYIRSYRVAKDGKQGIMRVYLKYNDKGHHVITKVDRVSRPSKRIYVKAGSVPKVRSGYGLAILSTNKGILSGEEASTQNVGGELLCKLW
ncbi:MAG: 30S ribosomal protein S8 [Bdellovibrionaceae bacterium]|nr:30S ribosomal protein S8 [Pseudobdellovibrionaceae bacterium]|tara:strand:- start:791 stop:1180 length:390 start_codon:yes stop_codon:yes gene_type:complete